MRRVVVLVLAGCSFRHGGASTGDAGPDAAVIPMPDAPPDAGPPPTSPRTLVLNNSAGATTMTNFPILVALDRSKIDYSQVENPLTDLKFTDSSGNLAYDVEHWDAAGESDVWVRVPSIAARTTTQSLTMAWGPGVGAAAPLTVWSAEEMMLHFEPPLIDPSGAYYAPTAINVPSVPGQIAGSARFAGTGDERITFNNAGDLFNGWPAWTLQFWIFPDYATIGDVTGEPAIMDKGGSLALGRFFKSGANLTLQIDLHLTGGNDAYVNTDCPLRQWTLVTYTFDGRFVRIYNNAVAGGTFDTGSAEQLQASLSAFHLGASSAPFAGNLDELRVELVAKSPDWIRAQYLSMTRQFVTFSP
jgi:hypothetical protein